MPWEHLIGPCSAPVAAGVPQWPKLPRPARDRVYANTGRHVAKRSAAYFMAEVCPPQPTPPCGGRRRGPPVASARVMRMTDMGRGPVVRDHRSANEHGCGSRHGGDAVRQPLSRDRIVTAALAYVDANCLDDLSMRRLGAELGVEAMSIYRYFPSKSALLDSVVCRVLGGLDLPDDSSGPGWELPVRAYARSFRALAREHPRLFPLLATVGPGNETLASVHVRMTRLWQGAGLDAPTAAQAQCALQGYVTGTSLWDVAPSSEGGTIGQDPDADFEFGLDVLISGLKERIAD